VKVGDLVRRKIGSSTFLFGAIKDPFAHKRNAENGPGIILVKHMAGSNPNNFITVLYPKTGQVCDVAEGLVEVISESR
jgi:hypothetical protein